MARKRFNFKSAGKLVTAREIVEPVVVRSPIGIKTPLEFSNVKRDENFYKMHFDAAAQIKDNFRNLLMTNFGERLGRGDLGANLKSLLYDASDKESVEAEAVRRVNLTASKSLPMIQVRDVRVSFLGLDVGSKDAKESPDYARSGAGQSVGLSGMVVFIKYDIPKLSVSDQAIEVLMTAGG